MGIDQAGLFLLFGEESHLCMDWDKPYIVLLPFHCLDQALIVKTRDKGRGFCIINDKRTAPADLSLFYLFVEVDGSSYVFDEASSSLVLHGTSKVHIFRNMEKGDETIQGRVFRKYVDVVQSGYFADGFFIKARG